MSRSVKPPRRAPAGRPTAAARRPPAAPDWEAQARGWERWEPVLLSSLGSVDPALLRALALAPGQRVVDFGCGTGDPALAIARWVGPRGSVLGVDAAAAMLRVARRRARCLGVRNARFRRGDMSRFEPAGARFDRVVSRYGLMFAGDVSEALDRMRSCLRPGGRIALAVWGPLERNPGAFLRAEAVRPFLAAPPPDPESAPHPMRLARPGRLAALLKGAGFRDVVVGGARVCSAYRGLEDYVRLQAETALADVYGSLAAAGRRRLDERLRRRFRAYLDGPVLRVPGHAWVAAARR